MAKLILIMGDLASGKSTLAKKLAEKTNSMYLIKDTMKETLSDDIGFTNRAENKKLSIASVSMMKYFFDKVYPLNINLILEANFHLDELQSFSDLAKKYNYELISLYLEGDTEFLYKRFMHRVNFEHRHPTHCTDDLITKEGFDSYAMKSRKEIENFPKNKITVLEDNYDDVFQKALQIINK